MGRGTLKLTRVKNFWWWNSKILFLSAFLWYLSLWLDRWSSMLLHLSEHVMLKGWLNWSWYQTCWIKDCILGSSAPWFIFVQLDSFFILYYLLQLVQFFRFCLLCFNEIVWYIGVSPILWSKKINVTKMNCPMLQLNVGPLENSDGKRALSLSASRLRL